MPAGLTLAFQLQRRPFLVYTGPAFSLHEAHRSHWRAVRSRRRCAKGAAQQHHGVTGGLRSRWACQVLAHSPLDKMVLSSNLAAGVQGRPAQHIVQHDVLNVVQHVGCGARLLWLSLQLSVGAQNSLACLLHVFRSAFASVFCYSLCPNQLY